MAGDVVTVNLAGAGAFVEALERRGHIVRKSPSEEPVAASVTVVDFERLSESGRDLWCHELGSSDHRRARTLVFGNTRGLQAASGLLGHGCMAHITSDGCDSERLATTVESMAGKGVKLSDYLPTGARTESYSLGSSKEVAGICQQVDGVLTGLGVATRLREGFVNTTEELLTNSVYNAPVDGSGIRRFAHWSRRREVVLEPHERIQVELRTTPSEIGISVRDPFGSLEPYRILQSVSRSAKMNPSQVEKKPGGAGLGIFFALAQVSHLIFHLRAGAFTEAIALLKLTPSYREFATSPRSFDVFDTKENHGR